MVAEWMVCRAVAQNLHYKPKKIWPDQALVELATRQEIWARAVVLTVGSGILFACFPTVECINFLFL